MTTRNLDALFDPKVVALIGASNQAGSVGAVLARNLLESGFAGSVLPVNPHERSIRSTLAYRSVADLPLTPDLAVIATPPDIIPGLMGELVARGCRAAVVITAGFGEAGGAGRRLQTAMLEAARPSLLRIVGPNCLGIISPAKGLNASFAQLTPPAGDLAMVAQSGAVTTAALDWASARGYGFSRIVTLGDMADVDFGDVLDFLALDAGTRAIVLYLESVTDARKFMSAARMAARSKPVTVIKSGRGAAGARAAMSHTGALAGADGVYDAAFRRAGLLRVFELRELFDAVTTLTSGIQVEGDRLAIVSNGGGAGVMAVDALEDRGGRPAELAEATLARLGGILPAAWSKGNPVDILGDADETRYEAAIGAVLDDADADAVLVLNCPTAVVDSTQAARAVVKAVTSRSPKPAVLTCWLGETAPAQARRLFAESRIPTHETPDEAVRAFMHLANHARHQRLLHEVPSDSVERRPNRKAAAEVMASVVAAERDWLTAAESTAVLRAYGVPVVEVATVDSPSAAAAAAERMGCAVALKIASADLTHKSDVGGVILGLTGGPAVAAAAGAMLEHIAVVAPAARIDGFIVQPMIARPMARELIAGIVIDPTFGPVVLFGAGGVAVEVLADRSIGLPPLNTVLARDMIDRTRIAKLLGPFRDRPAADVEAVCRTLIALAEMAVDLEDLVELDINPLLVDEAGVLAIDSRIRIGRRSAAARQRPAIRPYPESLVGSLALPAGVELSVRPIRPDDAPRLEALVAASSAEDVRLRFRAGLARLPRDWAARLSQIDYDREMALVAAKQDEILGVARLAADPEGAQAEFALIVRTDWQQKGLGRALLGKLLDHARARGIVRVWGDIDADNARMLDLAEHLGFSREPADDAAFVRAAIRLAGSTPAPKAGDRPHA